VICICFVCSEILFANPNKGLLYLHAAPCRCNLWQQRVVPYTAVALICAGQRCLRMLILVRALSACVRYRPSDQSCGWSVTGLPT